MDAEIADADTQSPNSSARRDRPAWKRRLPLERRQSGRRRAGFRSAGARSRVDAEGTAARYALAASPTSIATCPRIRSRPSLIFVGCSCWARLLKDVFLISNSILVDRLAELATFDLRKQFYRRTLRMDLATFADEGTSDLMSRFTHDMEAVCRRPERPVRQADPRAAEDGRLPGRGRLHLLAAAAALAGGRAAGRLLDPLAGQDRSSGPTAGRWRRWPSSTTSSDETFRGIKIVKAFTMERQERSRFHQNSKKYYRKAMKIACYDSLAQPADRSPGHPDHLPGACWPAPIWCSTRQTHLLGIRMCDRPLSWRR